MQYQLCDIATVNSGVYLKPSPAGTYAYLSAKHFDAYGKVRLDMLQTAAQVHIEGRKADNILQDGDLLLIAKGHHNRVCLYTKSIGPAVASSTFIVLRCKTEIVRPTYLQWLLNTSIVQRKLAHRSRGTHIMSLSIKTLELLRLDIPELQRQEDMVALHQLIIQEQQIQEELIAQKKRYYEQLLINKT